MGISLTKGNVTVSGSVTTTIAGNLPSPSGTQTIVSKGNTKTWTAVTAGAGTLLYTVTAGKTFYLTSFTISGSTAQQFEVRDSTTLAGTIRIGGLAPASTPGSFVFPIPMAFTSGLFYDCGANHSIGYTICGYEA